MLYEEVTLVRKHEGFSDKKLHKITVKQLWWSFCTFLPTHPLCSRSTICTFIRSLKLQQKMLLLTHDAYMSTCHKCLLVCLWPAPPRGPMRGKWFTSDPLATLGSGSNRPAHTNNCIIILIFIAIDWMPEIKAFNKLCIFHISPSSSLLDLGAYTVPVCHSVGGALC